jgi:hypothetical protein
MTTCLSIARGDLKKEKEFTYLEHLATSVDLNDVCHVLKSDLAARKHNKRLNTYSLREKMEKEIEKGMPMRFDDETTDLDVNKDFNSLLTSLRYQHSYVCKLVMNNLQKIRTEIEKEKNLRDEYISFDKYYDYSYVVNLMWNYRYVYAVKMFRDRMKITDAIAVKHYYSK